MSTQLTKRASVVLILMVFSYFPSVSRGDAVIYDALNANGGYVATVNNSGTITNGGAWALGDEIQLALTGPNPQLTQISAGLMIHYTGGARTVTWRARIYDNTGPVPGSPLATATAITSTMTSGVESTIDFTSFSNPVFFGSDPSTAGRTYTVLFDVVDVTGGTFNFWGVRVTSSGLPVGTSTPDSWWLHPAGFPIQHITTAGSMTNNLAIRIQATPEPSTYALLAVAGLIGVGMRRHRALRNQVPTPETETAPEADTVA